MCRRLLFVLLMLVLGLSGCMKQGFDANGRAVFNHRLGAVPITKKLSSIGEQVPGEVELYVTPEGMIQVIGGKGDSEAISVTVERDDLVVFLDKAISWGETAKKEEVSIDKDMGHLSSDQGIAASSMLSFTFASADNGQVSGLKMHFFYYRAGFAAPPKEKTVDVIVLNSGIRTMKTLVMNSENVLQQAAADSQKEDLFK